MKSIKEEEIKQSPIEYPCLMEGINSGRILL